MFPEWHWRLKRPVARGGGGWSARGRRQGAAVHLQTRAPQPGLRALLSQQAAAQVVRTVHCMVVPQKSVPTWDLEGKVLETNRISCQDHQTQCSFLCPSVPGHSQKEPKGTSSSEQQTVTSVKQNTHVLVNFDRFCTKKHVCLFSVKDWRERDIGESACGTGQLSQCMGRTDLELNS